MTNRVRVNLTLALTLDRKPLSKWSIIRLDNDFSTCIIYTRKHIISYFVTARMSIMIDTVLEPYNKFTTSLIK